MCMLKGQPMPFCYRNNTPNIDTVPLPSPVTWSPVWGAPSVPGQSHFLSLPQIPLLREHNPHHSSVVARFPLILFLLYPATVHFLRGEPEAVGWRIGRGEKSLWEEGKAMQMLPVPRRCALRSVWESMRFPAVPRNIILEAFIVCCARIQTQSWVCELVREPNHQG